MELQKQILSTLAYFDLFDYPLTQTEIYRFLQEQCGYNRCGDELQFLVNQGLVYKYDSFYSLRKDFTLIIRRRDGNARAKQLLRTAEKVGRLLYHFPFVRGIAVSGSLSKNCASEGADIDLFLITAKDRLWIARTLLHILKKISFLFNRQGYLCMNYFVDESGLCIEEKNIYTATEIVTLIPLQGIDAFREFYLQNKWTTSYLPNHSLKVSYFKRKNDSLLKRLLEFLLNHTAGNLVNEWLMRITKKRWNRKSKNGRRNSRGILMGMNASIHCAKPDPANFQIWLLHQYRQKVSGIFNHAADHLKAVY
ncbi:MAG TPA: hypothetical protein VFZ78_04975 [Flavisolibacter sp.]